MSDHGLLVVLSMIAGALNLYGLMVCRDVHRRTKETLRRVSVSLGKNGEP